MAQQDGGLDAHALPFITIESTGDGEKFSLNPDALEYLRSLKGRVAVVSVVGMYRTGKSYLLNQLMGKNTGFQVGPTVRSCTKGIWLWGKAMPARSFEGPTAPEASSPAVSGAGQGGVSGAGGSAPPGHEKDEEPLNVLFMDTEGLGSIDRHASNTYDTRVFALALLLSSFFLYNSVGTIDGAAISRLNLVVNLTQHIRVRAQGDADRSGRQFAEFFPNFLWVVRDFSVELKQGGRKIQAKDYLEKALEPEDGMTDEVAQKNDIRKAIRNFFPTRDCMTMVRPITDEAALAHLVDQPWDDLRPEFRRQVEVLRRKVFDNVRPNTVSGQPLTGPMLARLAEAYVDDLNQQGTPTISTAWDRVVDSQLNDAVDAAVRAYETDLATQLSQQPDSARAESANAAGSGELEVDVPARLLHPTPAVWSDSDLLRFHEHALQEAHGVFFHKAVQDLEKVPPFERGLFHKVQEKLQGTRAQNDRASEDMTVQLLQHVFGTLSEKILQSESSESKETTSTPVSFPESATEFRRLVERTRFHVEQLARGPAVGRVLSRFFSSDALDSLDSSAQRAQSSLRDRLQTLQRSLEDMTEQCSVAEQAAREAERKREDSEKRWEQEFRQSAREHEIEVTSLRDALSTERETFARTQTSFEKALEQLRKDQADRASRVESLQSEVNRLRSQVEEAQTGRLQSTERVAALEKSLKEAELAEAEVRSEHSVMQERVRSAENELVRLREQTELLYSSVRTEKQAAAEKQEEVDELTYQIGARNAHVAELQSEKSELETELASLREVSEAMKRIVEDRRLSRGLELDRVGWRTYHAIAHR